MEKNKIYNDHYYFETGFVHTKLGIQLTVSVAKKVWDKTFNLDSMLSTYPVAVFVCHKN